MQPLAIIALASGVVMVAGVALMLILTRRETKPRRGAASRWHRHGSIPLAAAGLALAVVSRGVGQSAATHDIVYAETVGLFLAALLCALVGATAATAAARARQDGYEA
jgi:formate-dependent nitrite reductase membrane component NrfD